jgi:hypothetical protein
LDLPRVHQFLEADPLLSRLPRYSVSRRTDLPLLRVRRAQPNYDVQTDVRSSGGPDAIETSWSTSLSEVGSNYTLQPDGGPAVELSLGGTPVVDGFSNAAMKRLDITGDLFHPEWNCTIKPRPP